MRQVLVDRQSPQNLSCSSADNIGYDEAGPSL